MIRAALAALGSVAVVLGFLASPACIIPSITQNSEDAGASASSTGQDAGASTGASAVKGASCAQVTSSVSLCQSISSCPSVTLNPQVFTQCGFYVHGDAIDPECVCQGEYLCPVGKPTTCAQVAQDSSGDVTYDSVCQQALTGGCQDLGTASTSGSSTSAACQACAANCDNVPTCIEACGC